MIYQIKEMTVYVLLNNRLERTAPPPPPQPQYKVIITGKEETPEEKSKKKKPQVQKTDVRASDKIGRNDACPCGSGKKYKNCCGK